MARTKQRRTYLPYTFPAVAGTHLPTPRGWRVSKPMQAQGAKSNWPTVATRLPAAGAGAHAHRVFVVCFFGPFVQIECCFEYYKYLIKSLNSVYYSGSLLY